MEDYSMLMKYNSEFEDNKGSLKKPSMLHVGALYSIAVVLFLYVGSRVQTWNFNYGIIINEFILILVPPLVFLFLFKFDVKKVLRLNKPGVANLFLVFGIMIFSLPLIGALNLLNLWIIKTVFGKAEVFQVPVSNSSIGLLIGIFVVGVSAGICEEVLFRGVIQRGFERFGAVKSIIITAFLFGLMHMDFQRLLGTFVLGILMGFLVYRSNSLFSGMFAHFANNSIAVSITYASLKANEYLEKNGLQGMESNQSGDVFASFENMPKIQLIGAIVGGAVMVIFSGICFGVLIYAFVKNTGKTAIVLEKNEKRTPILHFIAFVPGLLAVGLIYAMDVLRMGGTIEQSVVDQVFRAIGIK